MKTTTEQKELFTSGEWYIPKDGAQLGFRIMSYDGIQKTHIADCFSFSSGIPNDEAKNNAALIAESKNMYYALETLTDILLKLGRELTDNGKAEVLNAKEIINRINNHK